jgi:YD repeat-containing protein
MRSRTPAVPVLAVLLALAGCGATQPRTDTAAVAPDLGRSTIYEVFVRDFSPAGNLQGVTEGLDRIAAVGADIVWLMPVQPIGELHRKGPLGSPYSIRDYRGVNPDFGTAADFRALVAAVHGRGMKLIIDWVPNHTAWDHEWVSTHPHRYTRDADGRMTVPRNNDGELTDWTDVVELDYANADTRRAMIADMRYWLEEFGIDGFRVDVAGMVPDPFWHEALPELRAAGATVLLAEWGEPKMHELGFDLTYAWDSYHRLKAVWGGEPAASFVAAEVADVASLPAGGLRLRFTTNHDETAWDAPPVTLFGGPAGARAAFVAMALLPGTRLIYNGQEVESDQTLGLFVQEAIAWERPGGDEALAFYRSVVELARTHAALAGTDLKPIATGADADVIAYRRRNVIVLVNVRASETRVQELEVAGARELLGSGWNAARGTLGPYGYVVLDAAGG